MAVIVEVTEPSAQWNIVHNLGRIPLVQVMSSDNEVIMASVVRLTDSYATVKFNDPMTGKVLLV